MYGENERGITHDVVIVGAGPAGSAAASTLAQAGMRTIVLDSKMEVGAPVICGDLVNTGFPELKELVEDPRFRLAKPESIELKAGKASVHIYPSGAEGDAFNTVVERDRLDKELISSAVLAGAKLKIRAEALEFSQDDASVTIRFRAGGKVSEVSAPYAIIAKGNQGNGPKTAGTSSTEYSYHYGRFISGGAGTIPVINIGEQFSLDYLVPRGHGQFNRLMIRKAGETGKDTDKAQWHGKEIISGDTRAYLEEEPSPGSGRVLNAGSAAGFMDRFFMTGFREAFISGKLAAKAILAITGDSGDALDHYTRSVKESLLPGIVQQIRLRKAMANSDIRRIQELFSRLSEFEFHEISVKEMTAKPGMAIEEIEGILGNSD